MMMIMVVVGVVVIITSGLLQSIQQSEVLHLQYLHYRSTQ